MPVIILVIILATILAAILATILTISLAVILTVSLVLIQTYLNFIQTLFKYYRFNLNIIEKTQFLFKV